MSVTSHHLGQDRWSVTAQHTSNDRSGPEDDWPPIDTAVLQARMDAVHAFPLDLLAPEWSDWIADSARSVGAPIDYVAQAVLGAAAGLCGTRVRVRVSSVWEEPVALWLALVGSPSSGKTPALASVRRLLGGLDEADGGRKPHIVSSFAALDAVAAGEDEHGLMLWHDEPSTAFSALNLGAASGGSTVMPANVLCSLEPDRLAQTLRRGNDRLIARFLYAWPQQPVYHPLADRKPARDADALSMLRRLQHPPGTATYPLILPFDDSGVEALDGFLRSMHSHRSEIEGLEAAWAGKGGGTVARLAGVLELLDWSATQLPNPTAIGADQVMRATTLWLEYFWPHAKAFLDRTAPTDVERRARRVVRWLKATGAEKVSREDIRRHALGRTVNAAGADAVLGRLTDAGIVHCLPLVIGSEGGRPVWRWEVNPALATTQP